MSIDFDDKVPVSLTSIATRPLFVMRLAVKPIVIVGQTPGAFRRIGIVPGGTVSGHRVNGVVLDGSSDWQSVRADGSTTLDVRLVIRTHDDALITMVYRGVRHGPSDVIARLERGELVEPTGYYFRIAPVFETSSPTYDWLNRVMGIGSGHRTADGPIYSVFEVL
ncbi:hypothetical protein BH09PSE6_BH09PSE6_00930 [soil metagenome]